MSKHNEHVQHWRRVHQHRNDHWHPCMRDRADCTVKAIQNAFGWSKVRAYHHNEKYGRKHGRAMNDRRWQAAFKNAGLITGREIKECDVSDYGKTLASLEKALSPTETVIVNVRRHTLSYRQGYTNDWAESRRLRVQEIWRVAS